MTDKTCPSGRCIEGALLLGIVQADQSVGFVHPAIPLNADFIERARTSPQRRFRFAEPCATTNCGQWTGDRCSVIDDVLAERAGQDIEAPLPYCSIRGTCRWFSQAGRSACGVCRLVVTETIVQGPPLFADDTVT